MKNNKKISYASQPYCGTKRNTKKKTFEKEDIILLHRINVAGYTRQIAAECLESYANSLPKNHGKLNILNIVLPLGDHNEDTPNDVKLIYSDFNVLKDDIYPFLDETRQRKIKIFELLNNL